MPSNEQFDSKKHIKIVFPFEVPLIRQRMTMEDGFTTEKEALAFGNNACGAACLKMAFEAFRIKDISSVKSLMDEGMQTKSYRDPMGWIHKGIVKMARQHGLEGMTENISRDFSKLADELQKNHLIIASVSLGFDPKKKGGHLVVIYGAELNGRELERVYFRDPSGWGQAHSEIDGDSFTRSSTGNVIFLWKK
jgi:hypothetical protein